MEEQDPVLNELKEQRAILEEHELILKSIRRHMRWSSAWSILRVMLIAIPLILAFLYLPPLVQNFIDGYFPSSSSSQTQLPNVQLPANIDFNQLKTLLER